MKPLPSNEDIIEQIEQIMRERNKKQEAKA